MVCNRCISAVQTELENLGHKITTIKLGEVEISDKLTTVGLAEIENAIKKHGF